jgi:hypothetical protein
VALQTCHLTIKMHRPVATNAPTKYYGSSHVCMVLNQQLYTRLAALAWFFEATT